MKFYNLVNIVVFFLYPPRMTYSTHTHTFYCWKCWKSYNFDTAHTNKQIHAKAIIKTIGVAQLLYISFIIATYRINPTAAAWLCGCVHPSFTRSLCMLDDKFRCFIPTNRVFMKNLSEAAALQLLHIISRNYLCGNELQGKHTHTHASHIRTKTERRQELIQNKQALTQNHLYVVRLFVCLFAFPFFVVVVWFSFLTWYANSTRYYVKHFTCVRTRIICHKYEHWTMKYSVIIEPCLTEQLMEGGNKKCVCDFGTFLMFFFLLLSFP